MEPQDGHPVWAISHSPNGDRFVVATSSAQPKVYDRDGHDIITFVKGDMYLRDLSNTKGHTMSVTCVQWHPVEKKFDSYQ
jgi:WD40 repeat protein